MTKYETLQDVMKSTDTTTQKLLRKILAIEDKHKHKQHLDRSSEREIAEAIEKEIIQEIS